MNQPSLSSALASNEHPEAISSGRILYASLVDLSLPYGPGVNERGFLRDMLARFGERLHVVVPRPSRTMPNELEGLNTTFIPCRRSVRTVTGWGQANVMGLFVLPRAVRLFQPDLVVMRAAGLPLPQFATSRMSSVPYVLKTAGDVTFEKFYEKGVVRRSLKRVNQAMSSQLFHGAVCIDVVSPAQRKAALRLYPDLAARVHVVDNGVDLDLFALAENDEARARMGFSVDDCVVGYVGGFPMQRGGREVIDIVAALGPSSAVKGLIVGDSGEAEACRRYAQDRRVGDAVEVFGEADYGDVPDLMGCIDIGLSIRRVSERGQSEMKVRQYLATGLCVIGTTISNDFLRGQDFARVVETDETSDVLQAAESFVDMGRTGVKELGMQARAFAEANLSIAAGNAQRLRLWSELARVG